MQQTVVNLRIQVIDVKSFALDLQVPTYLPGRDVTQRIARDAGLDAYWPDKRRRLYWLRARGRLVGDDEKLADMGVMDGELVYLLPEPPPQSPVIEQPPEYPVTVGYAGAGYLILIGSMVLVMAWSIGWGVAIAFDQSLPTILLPGMALGLLCSTLARHAWGGRGNRVWIPMTALAFQVVLSAFVFITPVAWQLWDGRITAIDPRSLAAHAIPGVIMGMLGVLTGWLAWWGSVEPLPPIQVQQVEAPKVVTQVTCGICGQGVDPSVKADCRYGCGQVFHAGCLRAREAVVRGSERKCAVCERAVG